MSHSTSDRLDPLRAAIESGDKSRIADELHMLDKPSPGFASDDGSMRSHVLADHTDKNGETSYHQDQDQDQGTATSPPTCPPGPGGISDAPPGGISEPSILDIALDEYRRGNLTPVDVELGEMPDRAGAVMVAVAEHMRLLMGLRLALGEDRPLPYAASMPVRAGIADDKGTASKTIRALAQCGVVEHVGSLPPLRPGIDGTKLYAPPAVESVVELRDRRAA